MKDTQIESEGMDKIFHANGNNKRLKQQYSYWKKQTLKPNP